jgi:hypothetical protein
LNSDIRISGPFRPWGFLSVTNQISGVAHLASSTKLQILPETNYTHHTKL